MKLKRLRIALLYGAFCLFAPSAFAQFSQGSTGLLNIPSAENAEGGTIRAGANFLPKDMLPEYFTKTYNSGNYFVSVDLFSFFELTYRMTLIKSIDKENPKYDQQDRTFSVRIQPLKETKVLPGVAIGADDPLSGQGESPYESYYLVLTKGLDLKGNRLSATLGYYFPFQKEANKRLYTCRKGIFGGVKYTPFFYNEMNFIAEYDSRAWNLGVNARFWKHLNVHAFAYDFKAFSAGIRYECVLGKK